MHQKLLSERQNSQHHVQHAKQHSDPLQASQREPLIVMGFPLRVPLFCMQSQNEKQHDEEIKTIDLKEKKRSKSPSVLCEPELCVLSIASCLPLLANQHTNNILCVSLNSVFSPSHHACQCQPINTQTTYFASTACPLLPSLTNQQTEKTTYFV